MRYIETESRVILKEGTDRTCQWTGGCVRLGFLVWKKKAEREKEEASHAHVITNAAGIHDPHHLTLRPPCFV